MIDLLSVNAFNNLAYKFRSQTEQVFHYKAYTSLSQYNYIIINRVSKIFGRNERDFTKQANAFNFQLPINNLEHLRSKPSRY